MTSSDMRIVIRAALLPLAWLSAGFLEPPRHAAAAQPAPGVAILQIDTDRRLGTIDRRIYGQFLEEINHSVVDGLFAEQSFVVKAVNYSGMPNALLVHLQGSRVPAAATVTVYTITAGLHDAASLDQPDRIRSVQRTLDYRPDLTIDLDPYTVAVVEISASLRQDGQR